MSISEQAAEQAGETEACDRFREETRAWIERNCPPSMRTPMPEDEIPWGGRHAHYPNPDTRLWLDRMAARGWTAPRVPAEYGGGGLDAAEAEILEQELARVSARPAIFSFGLWMLAPVLLEYASEAQKQRFLPEIVRGDIRWCQGYSEPGAGSDLASLRTRAELDGDRYIVNGSKIWTTYSDKSDWIFCLVRTDSAAKHRGISFLLFDLETEGVERRPIELISGGSPFCETFFDDVRVPAENLVGPVNGGWEIAKRLLQYERQNVAGAGFGGKGRRDARDIIVDRLGLPLDPVIRDRLARHMIRADALALFVAKNERRVAEQGVDALVSVVKILGAKSNQDRSDMLIDAIGLDALGCDDGGSVDPASAEAREETRAWLRSRANSIEGGTSEINLNILAKAVLGLPT